MNDLDKNKEVRFILLPNFNISNTFNSGALGVFIGIYTGVIINLLVANEWKFEKMFMLICYLIAVLFLCVAVKQNSIVKELCENIKLNDNQNNHKTVNSILTELWGQKVGNKFLYRKHKHCFNFSLYSSFIIVLIGTSFYVYKGTIQTIEPNKLKQTEIRNDSLKLQNHKQDKVDSIKKIDSLLVKYNLKL